MSVTQQKNITPIGDRVLLKRNEKEEVSLGGIILPETANQKSEICEVIAVGPGKKDKEGNLVEMHVQVGDKVMLDKYAGQEFTLEEQEYLIVKHDDIVAIVKE